MQESKQEITIVDSLVKKMAENQPSIFSPLRGKTLLHPLRKDTYTSEVNSFLLEWSSLEKGGHNLSA